MELKKSPGLVFEDYDANKEFFSLEEDSAFSIRTQEIKRLDDPRPLGLSGHLRVKNESYSVAQAIESSIPALDELIITVQPYINDSGIDETYEICKQKKQKYTDKIKLFYYTPEVATIEYFKDTDMYKTNDLEDDIPNNSIHSFSHYTNFGLKEISYKYYTKIDADQIYLTDKLRELRDHILYADRFAKSHRSFMNKVFGKLLRPFCNLFYLILPSRVYICLLTFINKKCAFGMSGFQLTLRGGGQELDANNKTLLALNPANYKKELLDYFIPLSLHYNRFYCTNGGMDTCIFAPNSNNLYGYFKDHSVEMQNLVGNAGFRNLGYFWFHLGMIKRNYFVMGEYGKDYISLRDFLKTSFAKLKPKIQTKAVYKSDYKGFWDNLALNFEKDKAYIRKFLKQSKESSKS
ncbi:hypothetical protein BKH42_04265 [Helicobacter sp. 13S00482-2]|uniref:hypothetical protein n=1 Tax=Helicobacter sp. 13S00482-2 TaxID=1476200 RepID=UPI000BA513B4|nr:hypothetical protein [Helicobacter sp. 13S00482-2]PAF53719.1 hypothetical protein BKH42_04265 [Helicobacter sp. 13S00482-2]